jgi:hypothetical protein
VSPPASQQNGTSSTRHTLHGAAAPVLFKAGTRKGREVSIPSSTTEHQSGAPLLNNGRVVQRRRAGLRACTHLRQLRPTARTVMQAFIVNSDTQRTATFDSRCSSDVTMIGALRQTPLGICFDRISSQNQWRRCMGIEPALDQEAGRATVLKTAQVLCPLASRCPTVRCVSSNVTVACAPLFLVTPRFPAVRRQKWRQIHGRIRSPGESKSLTARS